MEWHIQSCNCGGDREFISLFHQSIPRGLEIVCGKCGFSGRSYTALDGAILGWNILIEKGQGCKL